MDRKEALLRQAMLLISRLERISADSLWAHRSSGQRGELLRIVGTVKLQETQEGAAREDNEELEHLEALIQAGFELLEKAARAYT
jgi:hypothetical protein